MYNPLDISHYFLTKYGKVNDITPMKLVKLVYISHGWYLGLTDNALIDENPEAWKYGPVIPSVYHYFKNFGGDAIKLPEDIDVVLPENIVSFLDKIWSVYGKCDAIQLSAKTHEIGSPWYLQWARLQSNNFSGLRSSQIPDNSIKQYYKDKLIKNKAKASNQHEG